MSKLILTGLALAALAGCSHEGIQRGSRAVGEVGHAGIESVKGAGHYTVCSGREFVAALRGDHGPKAQAIARDECLSGREHMNRASESMHEAGQDVRGPRTTAPAGGGPSDSPRP